MHWSAWVLIVWLISIVSFFVGIWIREQKAKDTEKFLRASLQTQRVLIAADREELKKLRNTDPNLELLEFIAQRLAEAQAKITIMDNYKMPEEAKYYRGVRHGLHTVQLRIQGHL